MSAIGSPVNWHAFPDGIDDNVMLWSRLNEDGLLITPGSSLTGFSLISSALPSIQPYYAQSSYIYLSTDEKEQDEIAAKHLTAFLNNSKSAPTIGPGAVMTTSTPPEILNHMISQKHQAAELGWIAKDGIVVSLDKKLDSALAALNRGQTKAAKNILGAFKSEVSAQTGKSINANAAMILNTCTDVALEKL